MYFDAYVSDFDSDDDEVAWPRYNDDEDEDDYDIQSVSTVELQPSRCLRRHVYEFGEFEETHGWVQCQSRSEQGRQYFYNMHSGCNTWCRPISRNINIPSVSLEKVTCVDDLRTSDLELMSISDDERERNLPATVCNRDEFSTKTQLCTLARLYHVPQMNSISDTENNFSESDVFAGEYCDEIDMKKDHSDNNNDDSETKYSFCIENFLETEILVGEGEVNTEYRPQIEDDSDNTSTTSSLCLSSVPRRTLFTTPRLKKIGFEEQIVKWQPTRTPKNQGGPRKIICEMYGVKTISYDLPEPDEVRPQAGVKSTRLSDSDDDDSGLSSSLAPNAITNKSSLYWHSESKLQDFTKNLHQPLLSSSSSSSSSGSSKSSNSDSSRSTSSSAFTCSTCSTCSTYCIPCKSGI